MRPRLIAGCVVLALPVVLSVRAGEIPCTPAEVVKASGQTKTVEFTVTEVQYAGSVATGKELLVGYLSLHTLFDLQDAKGRGSLEVQLATELLRKYALKSEQAVRGLFLEKKVRATGKVTVYEKNSLVEGKRITYRTAYVYADKLEILPDGKPKKEQ